MLISRTQTWTSKMYSSKGVSITLLSVIVAACGAKQVPERPVSESASESSSVKETGEAQSAEKSDSLELRFRNFDKDVVIDKDAPHTVQVELDAPSDASWSAYLSEQASGLVGARPIAENQPASKTSFEIDSTSIPPGSYFVIVLLKHGDQTKVFQPGGNFIVADSDGNSSPFVRIEFPNNTYRMQNDEVRLIENRDRIRFRHGEPMRIGFRYRDIDKDELTFSLRISADKGETWSVVLDNHKPGEPTAPDSETYILEWVPPTTIEPHMYSIELVASDGKSTGRGRQDFIGIGDLFWEQEVKALYGTNCALSGCHDSVKKEKNYDFTRYETIPAVAASGYDSVSQDFATNCVACHGAVNPRGGIQLDTQAAASANAAAIKNALVGNIMPVREIAASTQPAPLDATTKSTIITWIGDGALEAGFTGAVATAFSTHCISCHSAANPRKNIILETYAQISSQSALIKTVLESDTMPVTETAASTQVVAIDAAAKARIIKWVDDGARAAGANLAPEIRGAQSNRDTVKVLVDYWKDPVGTGNRNRAMPKNRTEPLPSNVLGKFLIWDMGGAIWEENQLRYRRDDNRRKLQAPSAGGGG